MFGHETVKISGELGWMKEGESDGEGTSPRKVDTMGMRDRMTKAGDDNRSGSAAIFCGARASGV